MGLSERFFVFSFFLFFIYCFDSFSVGVLVILFLLSPFVSFLVSPPGSNLPQF